MMVKYGLLGEESLTIRRRLIWMMFGLRPTVLVGLRLLLMLLGLQEVGTLRWFITVRCGFSEEKTPALTIMTSGIRPTVRIGPKLPLPQIGPKGPGTLHWFTTIRYG